jgi:hypothetical protein
MLSAEVIDDDVIWRERGGGGGYPCPYLLFVKNGSEAVEELEGREDLALHEDSGDDRGRGPPSRAHGRFEEPLFERKLAQTTAVSSDDGGHFEVEMKKDVVWLFLLASCIVTMSELC